jgi:FlaG/FlaF family flagellin (archaellin)
VLVIAFVVVVATVGICSYIDGRDHSAAPVARSASSQFPRAQAVADATEVVEQATAGDNTQNVSALDVALNAQDLFGGAVALVRLTPPRAYFLVRIDGVSGDVCINYRNNSSITTC